MRRELYVLEGPVYRVRLSIFVSASPYSIFGARGKVYEVARCGLSITLPKLSPIIPRDISSAKVLLWRQAKQWRGKVSDYGTANILQQTMTVGPGATIYSVLKRILNIKPSRYV